MELFVSFSEVMDFFKKTRLRFLIVVAVFGIVFGLMPLKFVKHVYTCDTTIVISCEVPEDAKTDYRLQYTSILNSRVQTAIAMASGKEIITHTAQKLGIDEKEINSISATQVNTAPVVKLTANTPNADIADRVANTAAQVLSERLTAAFPSPKLSAIVSDKAIPAEHQSYKAQMIKAGFLGLIIGFILYVCYGILKILTDKTIRNSHYVSEALNTKLLGTVPQDKEESKKDDSYRKLRAAVEFNAAGKKSFLVTDVCEHDGAASVAVGLARALSFSGKSVLLMDADLRDSGITEILKTKPEHTISDVLKGTCTAEQAVTKTAITGLSLVSGADATQNPADLLFCDEFKTLAKKFEQQFDYVIIHTPSEVSYPDADNIAAHAGSVIMVAKYGSTPYQEFKDSFKRLGAAGGHIIGFVTTDV
ncbi:polysaccharide biosynthesis tyrosine autokinase [Caproiciproducens galactitolivorans]|uniref:polysaccharide biosynthesis tyrosine autokinase n=1 Tax=Caproiciproducens galactitolivorans TaxID=642589 RepID=UPI00240A11A4|nr:polysaccharide biosynthesis tyrosine autokinase [Caproiciproducens galactitolivorans]